MLRSLQMLAAGTLALTALSCSPASGPVPRGGVQINPLSVNCGIGPYVIPKEGAFTTENQLGDTISDGDGADVSCTVRKTSDGFELTAQIEEGSTSASLQGRVSQTGDRWTGTGGLNFYHPDSQRVGAEDCALTVSATQQIQPGAVWASMNCAAARKEATGQLCGVMTDFVFENCSD